MDAFALPVEGTETRVNAQSQAYEYMTAYIESASEVGRLENAIGWYHSHPGYGCWLSGIDVSTQMLNQNFQEPFVAIVVDPVRTISAGKVCLGAFRTYPKGYKPPNEEPSEYQTIPLNKIEDFGVHCKQYYSLEVSYFKSSLDRKLLDSLWNKYWVNTLGSSGLLSNSEYTNGQILDLSEKLEQSESSLGRGHFSVSSKMCACVGYGVPITTMQMTQSITWTRVLIDRAFAILNQIPLQAATQAKNAPRTNCRRLRAIAVAQPSSSSMV